MENKGAPYSGMFMLVFLMCGAFVSLLTVWENRRAIEQPLLNNVIKGYWSVSFEKLFDDKLPVHEDGTDFWGALNYAIFKNGKSGVVVGDDGWLFTDEEFMQYPGGWGQLETKIAFVREVKRRLDEQNVKLVVALIPSKARVYEDKLGRYEFPEYKRGYYQSFRKGLKDMGVPVTDILWLMQEKKDEGFDLFLKTDTHWSLAGARMGARLVANEVDKNFPGLIQNKSTYVVDFLDVKEHKGDLLRYLPLGKWAKDLGVEPDYIKEIKIDQAGTPDASQETEMDLFGDADVPQVTLVGTSYSANKTWGFADFLKESLGVDILNAADEGMGPFETMKKYLQDNAFKKTPPKLLIWEIPERYIPVKYDLNLEGAEE